MGHQKSSSFIGAEGIFQHLLGWNIEVVGGLIQHEEIAGTEQHQRQSKTCFLSSTELADLLEDRVVAEAETA